MGKAMASTLLHIKGTATLSVSSTSASVAIPVSADGKSDFLAVRVYHELGEPVFISFTEGAGTATTSLTPVASGLPEFFAVPGAQTHLNAITASGSGTLYIAVGRAKYV